MPEMEIETHKTEKLGKDATAEQSHQKLSTEAFDVDKSAAAIAGIISQHESFGHWQDHDQIGIELHRAIQEGRSTDLVTKTNEDLAIFKKENPTKVDCGVTGLKGPMSCSDARPASQQSIGLDSFNVGSSTAPRLFLKSDEIIQENKMPVKAGAKPMSAEEMNAAVEKVSSSILEATKLGIAGRGIHDDAVWKPFQRADQSHQIDELSSKVNDKLSQEEFIAFGTTHDKIETSHTLDKNGNKQLDVAWHWKGISDNIVFPGK